MKTLEIEENNKYIIQVLGVPVAMPRPRRVKTKAGNMITISAPKPKGKPAHPAVQFKSDIRTEAQRLKIPLHDGPVKLTWDAYFPRPKRLLRKNDPALPMPHTIRPDRDNIDKTILDALTGIAYRDDNQVFFGTISKWYCGITAGICRPCVIIELEFL